MKNHSISLVNLRKFIRNVIKEEAAMPGRWIADDEPVDRRELDKLGDDGYGDFYEDDDSTTEKNN